MSSTIAQTILATIKAACGFDSSLLNWDDEINPTPVSDLEANVASYVSRYMGWPLYRVSLVSGVLTVEAEQAPERCAHPDRSGHGESAKLVLDVTSGREIYGRWRQGGFGICQMAELRKYAARG